MDEDLDGYSDDVLVLREAIDNQNKLLQKLCQELDEEREAASTAASEAMSMILRLQAEKATVAMEARQYRRMAEEKMQYAQESLEVFEQLMYRKEMETASLEFQVQAYRHRLLSVGLDDFDIGRLQRSRQAARPWPQGRMVSGSMWVDEGEDEEDDNDEDGHWSSMEKLKNSCPPVLRLTASDSSSSADHQSGKHSGNGGSSKKNRSSHPWSSVRNLSIKEEEEEDEVVEVRCDDDIEEEHKFGNATDGLDVENCKMNLDSNPVNFDSVSRFTSFHSAVGDDADIGHGPELIGSRCSFTSCRSADTEDLSEFDVHSSCPCLENGTDKKINELHGSVYDVFEVPHDRAEDGKICDRLTDEVNMDVEDRLRKPNAPLQHKGKGNFSPEEKAKLIKELYCSQAELNMRLQQLENERERMKQERSERTMEEFKLLKDINKRLETIQCQIESPKCEKQSPQIRRENSCISSIIEAILHFSI
ncbi:uncharacterized protein LOC116252267 [Nymphaea colorata]|nr:uncharacterized protein LOC116252267 [Nymphaea colorata]XP_031482278.1 uncharacterized protein LOC116252267 [Nymphaea colorata]XP_031482279.1 uncharacterized protein LOC116252267 [Nymphaea colorata]